MRRHCSNPCLCLSVLCFAIGCGASEDESDKDPFADVSALPKCSEQRGAPCIDDLGAVMCPVDTEYPGDELALCDQGSERGLLLHYGPTDYDDPNDVAHYLLKPGEEDENCTFIRTPNDVERYVKSYRGRMRPNSHHMILTVWPEDGFVESTTPTMCNLADTVNARWLVGSQDPQIDLAMGGSALGQGDNTPEPGDPDYGLGQKVAAHTPVRMDLHYTNPTNDTLLREAWVWFDYAEPTEVKTLVDMITFYQGQITVPPQSSFTTTRARCEAKTDRYVALVTGHAHQLLTRFSVWHDRGTAGSDLVYETYDWAEPGNLYYRDGIQNALPNPESGTYGGASGYLLVHAGEALTFECEYFNPGTTEVTLGETTKNEMCNVFGMYFPTDGDLWNCACYGQYCLDKVPDGVDVFSLGQQTTTP